MSVGQTQILSLPNTSQLASSSSPAYSYTPADPDAALCRTIKAVLNAKKVAVVVGAGISTAANVPDFRSSSGLFTTLKARFPDARLTSGRDLFDVATWKDPNLLGIHLSMLAQLHVVCQQAKPTPFHEFLKCLDNEGRLSRVYTQNIDGLEEKAGLSYGVPKHDTIALARMTRKSASVTPSNRKRKRGSSEQAPLTPRMTPPLEHSNGNDNHHLAQKAQMNLQTLSPSPQTTMSPSGSSNKTLAPPTPPSTPTPRSKIAPVDLFSRAIPLHGDLKTLSCPTCKHSVSMADYLEKLGAGEPVLCPHCSECDENRTAAGFRSRGISLLKSNVVLYGEEHEAGDRIGAVTSRDLGQGRRPDLLIVAGTSLKVPGTKRLVRELSKVIRPQPKEDQADEADQSKRPVYTIFLNDEFPTPSAQWKDSFDVWVRGDIQTFVAMVQKAKQEAERLAMAKLLSKLAKEEKKKQEQQDKVRTSQKSPTRAKVVVKSKLGPATKAAVGKSSKSKTPASFKTLKKTVSPRTRART